MGASPKLGAPQPVVVLLHGANRTGHSMVDIWHEVAEAQGLPDPSAVKAILAQARTLYAADPERLFLFGHSKGGIAAQVWANRTVAPWKAVGVYAGNPVDLVRLEGHNHWFYDMGEAIAADAWTWMAQVAR